APDAGDLVPPAIGTLGTDGYLAPEPDHHGLLLVDEDVLVRVLPTVETAHLQPEGDVADLVAADGHEVLPGAVVPPVGRIFGVHHGHRLPVAGGLGFSVGLEPTLHHLFELSAGVRSHQWFLSWGLTLAKWRCHG